MKDSYRLLSGLSQEMRSYMTTIVGFSYLIEKKCFNEDDNREYTSHIFNSCNQLIWLFDSFIDSAIIDIGNSKVRLKRCSLKQDFENLLSEFRTELKNENTKDIVLINENRCTDSLEVLIDSTKVFRVIRSLFQNAVNNTKSGIIKIGNFYSAGKIIFYVLDSGNDHLKSTEFLNAEDLDKSLSKFDDPGSAINLILAKKIVHLLGGTIWINDNRTTEGGIYFSIPEQQAESTKDSVRKHIKTLSSRLNSLFL